MFAVICLMGCSIHAAFAQQANIPLPPPQKSVDYNKPTREYDTVSLGHWTVYVERPLQTQATALATRVLTRLREKLDQAASALPDTARAGLQKLPIFLMAGPAAKSGGRDNGLEYFQKNAPQHDNTLDARWTNCIVVYCADNYVHLSDLWALKALTHEFAHAYHLTHWPENQTDIYRAWENARQRGLYRDVRDDQGRTVREAYALVNPLEYFAELSCMYFAACDYPPFSREQLRVVDPVGCAMIEKMWRVKNSELYGGR